MLEAGAPAGSARRALPYQRRNADHNKQRRGQQRRIPLLPAELFSARRPHSTGIPAWNLQTGCSGLAVFWHGRCFLRRFLSCV